MDKDPKSINEISLHYKRPHIDSMPKIKFISDVLPYFFEMIDMNRLDLKEHCWVALLTSSDRLLGIAEVSSGSVHTVQVHIREIFQLALLTNAVKLILIHNHPCGSLKPSASDITITRRILSIGKLMEIYLLEHLIVNSEKDWLLICKELNLN